MCGCPEPGPGRQYLPDAPGGVVVESIGLLPHSRKSAGFGSSIGVPARQHESSHRRHDIFARRGLPRQRPQTRRQLPAPIQGSYSVSLTVMTHESLEVERFVSAMPSVQDGQSLQLQPAQSFYARSPLAGSEFPALASEHRQAHFLGTPGTADTLAWALVYAAAFPHTQQKIAEEIDDQLAGKAPKVGQAGWIDGGRRRRGEDSSTKSAGSYRSRRRRCWRFSDSRP